MFSNRTLVYSRKTPIGYPLTNPQISVWVVKIMQIVMRTKSVRNEHPRTDLTFLSFYIKRQPAPKAHAHSQGGS